MIDDSKISFTIHCLNHDLGTWFHILLFMTCVICLWPTLLSGVANYCFIPLAAIDKAGTETFLIYCV